MGMFAGLLSAVMHSCWSLHATCLLPASWLYLMEGIIKSFPTFSPIVVFPWSTCALGSAVWHSLHNINQPQRWLPIWTCWPSFLSNLVGVGITVKSKLQSYTVKLLACVFVKSGGGWGAGNHSQVKIPKLVCKSAGPYLCQIWRGRGWFWCKNVLNPNNFHVIEYRALVLSDG